MRWWVVAAAGLYASTAVADPIDDLITVLGRFAGAQYPATALSQDDVALAQLAAALRPLGFNGSTGDLKNRLSRITVLKAHAFIPSHQAPGPQGGLLSRGLPPIVAALLDSKVNSLDDTLHQIVALIESDQVVGIEVQTIRNRRLTLLGTEPVAARRIFEQYLQSRSGIKDSLSIATEVGTMLSDHPAVILGTERTGELEIRPDRDLGLRAEADFVRTTKSAAGLKAMLFDQPLSDPQRARLRDWYIKAGIGFDQPSGLNGRFIAQMIEMAQSKNLVDLVAALARNSSASCAVRTAGVVAKEEINKAPTPKAAKPPPPTDNRGGFIERSQPPEKSD